MDTRRPNPTHPKETKERPAVEKGDARRPIKREFIVDVLMKTGCDNCNWKIDKQPVCTNNCVVNDPKKIL